MSTQIPSNADRSDDKTKQSQTDIGGGTFLQGDVETKGDFVGRDKTISGDEIHGDKIAGDKNIFVLPFVKLDAEVLQETLPEMVNITISDDEQSYLTAELAQHRLNVLRLRKQKAIYAEGEEPIRLLNQIDAEETAIRKLEQQLQS